eukprot:CAMPEP_0116135432 /NCGR_PEP_ID=MMETSP0329-20121206/11186_1 /TAXON_ID=697910 /ORGANISM="Pseudo-nitzschia arenysensis, Strain B593" /LENGTH=299 /DNA_ID=CAMNT_0003630229 /DNA_START=59 /DNA_END=958 /DNA_ORIENTATION=-
MKLYPRISTASIVILLFALLLGILPTYTLAATAVEDSPALVPTALLQKAITYVQEHNYGGKEDDSSKILSQLEARDVRTLYEVAKTMNTSKTKATMLASIDIWMALGHSGHILSQVALGFAFAENDKPRAIEYFKAAGEKGSHQVALFNAGRLMAEPEIGDYIKSLAYIRAAYQIQDLRPEKSTAHMVETSKVAYERLSEEYTDLIFESMTQSGSMLEIQTIADMFPYADLNGFPKVKTQAIRDWHTCMRAMQFNEFELAQKNFQKFADNFKTEMSELQSTILQALLQYCVAAAAIDEL